MRFSIITPTYNRSEKLLRAVKSVQQQTYSDWELLIVNDSPLDTRYASFETSIEDPRIRYLKNTKNEGVNFSRNRALEARSNDSAWTIFLDDDDYLAPDALATAVELITKYPLQKWFLTNRAYKDGKPITSFPKEDHAYSYSIDYLLLRHGKGDATHWIQTELSKAVRFSTRIRQAEEWLFFYQIGCKSSLFYHGHNSTITDGYSADGLNFRIRSKKEQLLILSLLLEEGLHLRLWYRPTFILYLTLRCIRSFLR